MGNQSGKSEAFAFYSASISSFLESAVDEYVENLSMLCGDDAEFGHWLDTVWRADERRHGDRMRSYVVTRWPQFSWDDAFAEYMQLIPRSTMQHLNSSKALEMLSRCVTETEATMMYRCIRSSADDERLRRLTAELSTDEVRHYKMFKRMFGKYQKEEGVGLFRAVRTILKRADLTVGRDVALAFRSLNNHWHRPGPFRRLDFRTFLAMVGRVVAVHFPVVAAERMLLKPLDKFAMYSGFWRFCIRRMLYFRLSRSFGSLAIPAA